MIEDRDQGFRLVQVLLPLKTFNLFRAICRELDISRAQILRNIIKKFIDEKSEDNEKRK